MSEEGRFLPFCRISLLTHEKFLAVCRTTSHQNTKRERRRREREKEGREGEGERREREREGG